MDDEQAGHAGILPRRARPSSRGLMEGNADGTDIIIVLAVAVAQTAVFAPLTTWLYRRS